MNKFYNVPDTNIRLMVSRDGSSVYVLGRWVTQQAKSGKSYRRAQPGRYLTFTSNGSGYLQISLSHEGSSIKLYLHRVVWLAHKGPIPEGLEVDHIDEDKTNCALSNLQLLTHRQNVQKTQLKLPKVKQVSLCACGSEKNKYSVTCITCYNKERITHPDITAEAIEYWVTTFSWVRAAKELGLTDNGLRKRYSRLSGKDPKSLRKIKAL